MKPPYKILLALTCGVLAAVGLSLLFRQHADVGREGPEITLQFAPANAAADMEGLKKIVSQRLQGRNVSVSDAEAGIAVAIPYPEPRQKALERLQTALLEFRKTQMSPAKIEAILQLSTDEREGEIRHLAPIEGPQRESLENMARAADGLIVAQARAATRPADSPAAVEAVAEAQDAIRRAHLAYYAGRRLTAERLERILAAADSHDAAALKARQELPAEYPALATEILQVADAYDVWRAAGGGGGMEPEEIERLLTARGIVEFRKPLAMKQVPLRAMADAADQLWKRGPDLPVKIGAMPAVWVQEAEGFAGEQHGDAYVEAVFEGDIYLLCSDVHEGRLTHDDPLYQTWKVTADAPYVNPSSKVVSLPIHLDAVGGKYLEDVAAKLQGALVVVCDGRVMNMPPMQSPNDGASIITWGMPIPGLESREIMYAQDMRQAINAVLPVELRRVK